LVFQSIGEFGCRIAIFFDKPVEFFVGAIDIFRIPDPAQFSTDHFLDFLVGSMVDCVLGQVMLAAVPRCSAKYGLSRSFEPGMIVGVFLFVLSAIAYLRTVY